MPTGYTSNLYEGKDESFQEFVLHCARGMGAFIMQRDDAMSDKPALRKVGDYYFKRVAEATAELAEWNILSSDDKYAHWQDYADKQNAAMEARADKDAALRKRYAARLEEVRAWQVPPMLQSFKDFMIDQINSSIEFDCHSNTSAWYSVKPYSEWVRAYAESLERSLDLAEDSLEEEVRRVKEQNIYTYALYNALGMEYNGE